MSKPTGKTRISMIPSCDVEAARPGRRAFLGASALLAGATVVDPRTALAESDGVASHSPVLDKAWAKFEKAIAIARKQIYGARFYNYSPLTRAQAHLFLDQIISIGYGLVVAPRQLYPVFYTEFAPAPMLFTYGLAMCDVVYKYAMFDGSRTYRIWGKRNTAKYLTFAVSRGAWGDENATAMATYDIDKFKIESDGSFEIIASAKKPSSGNWIEIDAASKNDFILVRNFHLDWETERPAELHIERTDIDSDLPYLDLDEAELARRIEIASGLITKNSRFYTDYVPEDIYKRAGNRTNVFVPLNGSDKTLHSLGTETTAFYVNAIFEVKAGEALIIETPPPEGAFYYSFMFGDIWMQSADYMFHQSSLNQSQMVRDHDGMIRVVLSLEDPGVANWLDPMGNTLGYIVFRNYGAKSPTVPKLTRVPLAQVRDHLPADTMFFSAKQRSETLRRRRTALRRYGY